MPLNDQMLAAYMKEFYGYGNFSGRWWLVGMEEGGGDTVDDIQTRLRLWDRRGRRELEDVDVFSSSREHAKWFSKRPPLQPTWRMLIRLMLSAEGRPTDTGAIRAYQAAHLGRRNSDNCILELLPLPSPSTNHWVYGEHSALPQLKDRPSYRLHTTPPRIARLRELAVEHRPRAIVFYGHTYRSQWEQVAGSTLHEMTDLQGLHIATGPSTVFALVPHPTYPGMTNAFFEEAGRSVAGLIR